jgi:hypothetical protein
MLPHKPEDWLRLFEQHLRARDLDAVVALYEPEPCFVMRTGETIIGRERVRPQLAGMIDANTQLRSRVMTAVTADELALLYTDFEGHDGRSVGKNGRGPLQSDRDPPPPADGSWKLISGDPNGRA